MLQECGYIYKQHENNIILIHSKKLTTIPNINYHKSIISTFLNNINECNICFKDDYKLLSGCYGCGFIICLDCMKHTNIIIIYVFSVEMKLN